MLFGFTLVILVFVVVVLLRWIDYLSVLGLFFITVGMLLNIRVVIDNWWLVLLLLGAPVLLKFALIAGLARLFGSSNGVALRTGLGLAQAGEFGFVLLNLAGGIS